MANEVFIQGQAVLHSIYNTGATAWEPIGCATTTGASDTLALNETETKCEPGVVRQAVAAVTSEKTGEGVYIDEAVDTGRQSYNLLKGYVRNRTRIEWREATGISAPTNEYGFGYITSCDMTADTGSNVTFTYTITVDGAITNTDPHP